MEIKIDDKELTINPEKIIGIAIGCANLLKRYSIYKIMATGGEIAATVLPNKTQKILVKTGSKLLGLGMAFEMMFFGKVINRKTGPRRSNSTWRFDGEQPIAYDRINDRRPSAAARNGRRPSSAYVEEIVVDTYNDAAAVLEELIAYLEQYGRVPVSAYYDAFGVSNDRPWTDQKWGWTSLREAKVGPVRGGGYTVYLPDPEAF